MGTSIHAGIRVVEALGLSGAILALADQPLITPAILRNLADEHQRTGKPVVTSQYAETVGVPVYFAQSYFSPLLALPPDQGCKGVILKHADSSLRIDCPEAGADIDTPLDYERLGVIARSRPV
jgi:molybdenum cofactor cytidylyltransferase